MNGRELFIKKILIIFLLWAIIFSAFQFVSSVRVSAATEGQIDSHGNIVPAGREEVDRSKPVSRGIGSVPQNTEEALAQGYSKRIGMTVNRGQVVFFWVRETEIVPKGEKPLDYVNVYKLNTDVRGTSLGTDYGDAATTVDVKATRYIYDDGDFTPPDKNAYHSDVDMMGPFRGLPPASELPVPAYSFLNDDVREKYLSKNGKAEVGTFWGSADKTGEVYYCMNPNSVDPVENTQYFKISPKYDYQSNYRDVPETHYILATLLYNAGFYNDDGSPNWNQGFDNLVKEFNKIVENTNDTSSQEPGMLDKRIKIGELRDRLNTLMGWNGNVVFSGETMRLQKDEGTKPLSGDVSNSGYDKKSDILVLGFEYPIAHYMQGMPISEADQWFGRSAMWGWGVEGYVESRTIYGRAFARMLIAYTELAREKKLIANNGFNYEDITLKILSKEIQNNKIVAKFAIDNVEAEGVSGYSIVIPEELHEKVKVTKPIDILEIPGAYAFSPSDLKDGFYVEIDSSVTNEEIQKVKVTRHFRDKNLGVAYSAKNNYRYDETTKRWYIREMVAADVSGYSSRDAQKQHGVGYGQELIKFSKEKNSVTRSIELNLTQPVYDIKTIVGADVYDETGKKIFKNATETSELSAIYSSDQIKEGIHIKDTVAYKGLDNEKEYRLIGVLNEITNEENGSVVPVAVSVGSKFVPDKNVSNYEFVENAKTEIDFGIVKNLIAGKKYVVYEYLFDGDVDLVTNNNDGNISDVDREKALVKHENAKDKAQTFKPIEPLSINTVVYLGMEHTENGEVLIKEVTDTELKDGINVYDRINYTGLEMGKKYKFISVLNEIGNNDEVIPIKAVKSQDITANDKKIAMVFLGKLQGLKPNTKYVIYEYLFNVDDTLEITDNSKNISDSDRAKALAKHENKEDKSQTFLLQNSTPVQVSLTSQVEVSIDNNGELFKSVTFSASKEKPLILPVEGYYFIDETLNYQGLEVGQNYNVYVYLKEKMDDGGFKTVKVIEKEFFVPESNGSTSVSFMAKLDSNKKYVLHDYVVPILREEKDSDTPDISFRLIMEDTGHTIDEGEANEILKNAKIKYAHETEKDDFTQSLEVRPSVMETTVKDGKNIASGREPLSVSGKINTISDIVKYSGLIPGIDYQVQGAIIDFENYNKLSENDKQKFDPFKSASSNVVVSISEIVHFDTNNGVTGEVEVVFNNIDLEEGKKYVVFERISSTDNFLLPLNENLIEETYPETPRNPHVLNHFDINDLKQTFSVPETPTIATIVKVNGKVGSVDKAATLEIQGDSVNLPVMDTVKYEKLQEGKEYKLIGVLKNKTDNKIVAVKVGEKFTPSASKETVIDFGDVKLEAGKEYIAYEYLFEGESILETVDQKDKDVVGISQADKTKAIAIHENDNDKAQSIVITKETPTPKPETPTIATIVKVNGKVGSVDKAATLEIQGDSVNLPVMDTVKYEKLQEGKEYKLIGVLKNKTDNKIVAVKVGEKFTPSASKETVIDFGDVKLEAGKEYIAYEYLFEGESILETVDQKDKDVVGISQADKTKAIAIHENDNDKAQSIVIIKETPTPPPILVSSLNTTVEVNGVKATEYAPVEVDEMLDAIVVDYIEYTGLFAGNEYTFTGRLMEIDESGNEKLIAVAKTVETVVKSDGLSKVTFTHVKLEGGKKYVVYEVAESTEKLVNDGKEKHVVKHEDPNDKSQTIKVIVKPIELPKTGINLDIVPYASLSILLGIVCLEFSIGIKRKNQKY